MLPHFYGDRTAYLYIRDRKWFLLLSVYIRTIVANMTHICDAVIQSFLFTKLHIFVEFCTVHKFLFTIQHISYQFYYTVMPCVNIFVNKFSISINNNKTNTDRFMITQFDSVTMITVFLTDKVS